MRRCARLTGTGALLLCRVVHVYNKGSGIEMAGAVEGRSGRDWHGGAVYITFFAQLRFSSEQEWPYTYLSIKPPCRGLVARDVGLVALSACERTSASGYITKVAP